MKFAKDSISWILISFIIALIFFVLTLIISHNFMQLIILFISFIFIILTIFFLVFFRDPERKIGDGFVACADGKIREIIELDDKDVGICFKVSTFMNINNVHINRIPIAGRIVEIQHFSGFHIPAFKKESENNERVVTIIETKIGYVKIVQIAGTLARRIIPYIKKDQKVDKGNRLGIIRLGSRVDVFIPKRNVKKLCINVGDRVFAGEDTIAEIND